MVVEDNKKDPKSIEHTEAIKVVLADKGYHEYSNPAAVPDDRNAWFVRDGLY